MAEHGFFIGRLNPIHIGHEQVIDHMIETHGIDNSAVVIGSSNAETSMRHFFSYVERRAFIKTLYPELDVVGLPDYKGDAPWLQALDDIIEFKYGQGSAPQAEFFGGSEEDVGFFLAAGRRVRILNRYDGTTPKISASEVRDSLLHERPLEGLLNPKIACQVAELFHRNWQIFKNT
jgi:hypothetical protein